MVCLERLNDYLPAISKQIMHIEKATTIIIGNWEKKEMHIVRR